MAYHGIKSLIILFILAHLAGFVLMSCDLGNDDDDDDNNVGCTDDFCQASCMETQCTDAGLSDWGECKGTCVPDVGCSCKDTPCHIENCDNWCKTSLGKTGGYCDIFECICT
ncbi:MAG: hypothetical protein GY847_34040 [Proteobacteria bacterium]|nr:hypothetical protein [Pseudomonadota bacterium]